MILLLVTVVEDPDVTTPAAADGVAKSPGDGNKPTAGDDVDTDADTVDDGESC